MSLKRANLLVYPIGGTLRDATPSVFLNVTLDGCCDHRTMIADEDSHRHAVENLDQADALLFGRVRESGKGLFVGGVKLPLALAELGLIDEFEFVVHPD